MGIAIPQLVVDVLRKIEADGFQVYLVGGCVRDLLLQRNRGIVDWDMTTNASPKEIQKLFPHSRYDNEFFTVFVYTDDPHIKEIHITTFRTEKEYHDSRHPTAVVMSETIHADLERRDFTINALAMRLAGKKLMGEGLGAVLEFDGNSFELIDLFGGIGDLKKKIIRAVGDPATRFTEDALRLLRAVRFATQLGFTIEAGTFTALTQLTPTLKNISSERIRDELIKILESDNAYHGVEHLRQSGLLQYIIPELLEGVGCKQNKHHIYEVYEHNVLSLKFAVEYQYSFEVRFAALLHDVGKPRTKKGESPNATFYHHEIVGAKMTKIILERLKFPTEVVARITHLVRQHLFYYDIGKVTEAGVRRFIARVGKENLEDLIKLRIAERMGSGVAKAKPYRLRHLEYMVDKVSKDPISVAMLAINGTEIMKILDIKPGPKIGLILNALLEEVLEDPSKNIKEYLISRVKELDPCSVEELKTKIARISTFKEKDDKELKRKHKV